MKRVVPDWSLLGYRRWHGMKSPNYKAKTKLEIEDFAILMAQELYKYAVRFQPDDYILALDVGRPFRSETYDFFYDLNTRYWKSLSHPKTWVISYDHKYYKTFFHGGQEVWIHDKLGKLPKEEFIKEIDPNHEDFSGEWLEFPQGKTPPAILKAFPDSPKTVKETEDWIGLKEIAPGYKKGRDKVQWKHDTPKEQFKKNLPALAHNLAPVVGARCVGFKTAEADDVAAILCEMYPNDEIILITADQDWQQLIGKYPNVSIWDPFKIQWCYHTREHYQMKLFCKLLGGDGSDKIAGISIDGRPPCSEIEWEKDGVNVKTGKNSFKLIQKMLKDHNNDYGGIHQSLMETSTDKSYYRNLLLISFDCIPAHIKAGVWNAILNTPVKEAEFKLTDFSVDLNDCRSIEHKCLHMVEIDSQVRHFEDGKITLTVDPVAHKYEDH